LYWSNPVADRREWIASTLGLCGIIVSLAETASLATETWMRLAVGMEVLPPLIRRRIVRDDK